LNFLQHTKSWKDLLEKGYKRAIIKFDEVYEGVGSIGLTKLEELIKVEEFISLNEIRNKKNKKVNKRVRKSKNDRN